MCHTLKTKLLSTMIFCITGGKNVKISRNTKPVVLPLPEKLSVQRKNTESHCANLESIRRKPLLFQKLASAVQEPNAKTYSSFTILLE